MAKMEHFEIPVDDIARASAFYKAALDLEYEPWGEEMGMIRSSSGEGSGGDLHLRQDVPSHPTVVFTVDRIEDTLELVTANGGELVGEIQAMDETSRYAYIKDSEGNVIGLYDEAGGAAG
jgi:predicted enzyme related to lactoylglutathione lyase